MALLKRKPIYKLNVTHAIASGSTQSVFYFSNKNEIKLFLNNSLGGVFRCQLYKRYINYENNDLSTNDENINTELENIKYIWYRLQIGTSVNEIEIFSFNTLLEVKSFLSKYATRLTLDLKYYVEECTKYFDKDDNYKIKQTSTILTDI